MGIRHKNIVGELINFRGLVYAPVEENGVIFLFSKLSKDLNLNVETIRKGFPDCIAKRYIGKDRWEEVFIEFEYSSSDFKRHNHLEQMKKGSKCDMIVCWKHDWKECPEGIEVLELRSEYRKYDNTEDTEEQPETIAPAKTKKRSDGKKAAGVKYDKNDRLFQQFRKAILAIDESIWEKPANWKLFYYSPERVFFNVAIQKQGLRIVLFKGGKPIREVEPVSESGTYGAKYGVFHVLQESDIPKAVRILSISLKRIRTAIRKNEPTGWYAEVE